MRPPCLRKLHGKVYELFEQYHFEPILFGNTEICIHKKSGKQDLLQHTSAKYPPNQKNNCDNIIMIL
jgi:hypothetical protein